MSCWVQYFVLCEYTYIPLVKVVMITTAVAAPVIVVVVVVKIVAVRSGSSSSRNNSSSSDRTRKPCLFRLPLIASFMGPTWGPPGANRTQVVLISAPWTLLSLVDNVNLIWKMSTVKIAIHDRDTCVRSRYMGVSISNYNPQITVGFNYLPIPYVSTCHTSPQFRKDKNIR